MTVSITDPREELKPLSISPNGHNGNHSDVTSLVGAGLINPAQLSLLTLPTHDEGNAQCVLALNPNRFHHNDSLGWLKNDGTHWTREGADALLERTIVQTLTARIDAALKSGQADKHGDLIKKSVPNNSRVMGAKSLFRSLVYTPPSTFDADPNLLNCPNGVVDLRTGAIIPHSSKHKFMYCTMVSYQPDADIRNWVSWLNRAVGEEQAHALKLAAGYSLTGHTREEIMFYLFGPPRSGKGTFIETLLAALGTPLALATKFSTFTTERNGDTQNFDLAPMQPCRVVAASESNSYERFNEAKLKNVTGGDTISCAFKFGNSFSYRPQFKIWLSSNHPVNADPDDDAVWGRIRVVHFGQTHLGAEDKLLKQSMRTPENLAAVLAWAVQGAMEWYKLGKTGLQETKTSQSIKSEHRAELDDVQSWIEDYCTKQDGSFCSNSSLYRSYENWCKSNGYTQKLAKRFGQTLKRKGFADVRRSVDGRQTRGYIGLSVNVTA